MRWEIKCVGQGELGKGGGKIRSEEIRRVVGRKKECFFISRSKSENDLEECRRMKW